MKQGYLREFALLAAGMQLAWDAIRGHKMRSGLTLLGIIIGIVTVTLMGTAIEGLNLVRPGQLQASLVLRHALTSQGRLCQTFDLLKGSSCSG